MAANGTQLNPGSGGDTIVTDPQSDGSRVEVATVGYGARGTDVQRVDPAHPLPVVDASVATLQAADHTDLAGLLSQLTSFTGADHTDLAAVLMALGPIATQTTLAALLTKLNGSLTTAPTSAGDVVTGLNDGRQVVPTPGTPVRLGGGALPCKWVVVTALTLNTQQVNLGGSDVIAASGTSTGIPLLAGQSTTIPIADAHNVYVDARVANEGVTYMVGA